MEISDLFYTYAKIIDDETDQLVGYALHIITQISDCGYVSAGDDVHTVENANGFYEIEIHINPDASILHFPYNTPLVHVVNLAALELDKFPDRKMEIVVKVDGKKQEPTYPVNQPSPNEIRRPIKKKD